MQIVELATALNRHRSLSDTESRWLERALKREDRRQGRSTDPRILHPWTKAQKRQLERLIQRGFRSAQIAMKMNRTPRAIIRQAHRQGLSFVRAGQGSVAVLEAAE